MRRVKRKLFVQRKKCSSLFTFRIKNQKSGDADWIILFILCQPFFYFLCLLSHVHMFNWITTLLSKKTSCSILLFLISCLVVPLFAHFLLKFQTSNMLVPSFFFLTKKISTEYDSSAIRKFLPFWFN